MDLMCPEDIKPIDSYKATSFQNVRRNCICHAIDGQYHYDIEDIHTCCVVLTGCKNYKEFLVSLTPYIMIRKETKMRVIKVGENRYQRHNLADLAQVKGFRAIKTNEQLEQEYVHYHHKQKTKFKNQNEIRLQRLYKEILTKV